MNRKILGTVAIASTAVLLTTTAPQYSNISAASAYVNPIKNAGFESDFGNWTLKDHANKDITISSNAYDGKKALQIVQTENELSQKVKVKSNTNYDITFYGLYSGPAEGGAIIEVFGEDGEMLLKGVRTPYRFAEWYQKTISFDSDANQTITITIKNELGGTFLLDNIAIAPQGLFPNHLKNPGYASTDLDMWEVKHGGSADGQLLDFDPDDPWVVTVESKQVEGIDVADGAEEFGEKGEKSIQFTTNGSGNEIRQSAKVLQDTEYIFSFKYRYAVSGLCVSVLSDVADTPLLQVESLESEDESEDWHTFEGRVNSGQATTLTVVFKDVDTAQHTQLIREAKIIRVYKGLRKEVVVDPQTGRKIHAVGAPNFIVMHNYITAMDWSADSTKMVMTSREVMAGEDYFQQEGVKPNSQIPSDRPIDLVMHDTVSGENIFLDHTDSSNGMTDAHDKYYYRSFPRSWTVYSVDLNTFERRMIVDQTFAAPLSVTKDGSTLALQVGSSLVVSVNTETREYKEVIRPKFDSDPFNGFNHTIINPIYPNLIHYIHDNAVSGGNGDIDDRLWVADANTGQHKLWYKQRDEWAIHHIWAADGMGMYWCNLVGRWSGPTGIMYSPDGGIPQGQWAELINDDYKYLHVSVSPDGRYLVADTEPKDEPDPKGNYKIVLIDLETRQSELLAQFHFNMKHNGNAHAHPTFSWDSKKVSFTYDIDNALYAAYIDLDEEKGDILMEQ